MQSTLVSKALFPAPLFCSVRGVHVQIPRALAWDGWWLTLPILPERNAGTGA
jgi:hypothetical protein